MTITVNGRPHKLAGATTVGELIHAVAGSSRGTAAVVDGEVVPRSAWSTTALHAGQVVELITAVQGG